MNEPNRVSEVARDFVVAVIAYEDASGATAVVEAASRRDLAWHELAFVVLGKCRYCEPGSCPFEEVTG